MVTPEVTTSDAVDGVGEQVVVEYEETGPGDDYEGTQEEASGLNGEQPVSAVMGG